MTLGDRLEPLLGERPTRVMRLHDGCIAEVYGVWLAGGERVVVKVDDERASLELEAAMLRYLAEHSSLPVPEVFHTTARLLVLEYLPGESRFSSGAEQHAAELLAALHEVRAEHYGFAYDTLIGPLPQPNPPTESWVDFFREHRLRFTTRLAFEAGQLPERVKGRLERLATDLDNYLDEPPYPSLVHNDIWTSNVLAQGPCITGILDPALYYADAEVEGAYIVLFNSFGSAFFERYDELRPPRAGLTRRREVYSLYPLLVHVTLFGGAYAASVVGVLDRLGVGE